MVVSDKVQDEDRKECPDCGDEVLVGRGVPDAEDEELRYYPHPLEGEEFCVKSYDVVEDPT